MPAACWLRSSVQDSCASSRRVAFSVARAVCHIALWAEYVNSFAVVYLDGKRVGEIRFPAGEVNLTALWRPGGKHVLSLHVVAMPLTGGDFMRL